MEKSTFKCKRKILHIFIHICISIYISICIRKEKEKSSSERSEPIYSDTAENVFAKQTIWKRVVAL